jgi:hypothetical protein
MLMRTFQIFLLASILLIMGGGNVALADRGNQVRQFTRGIEFDYVEWTIEALQLKLQQVALGTTDGYPDEAASEIVREMINLVEERGYLEWELNTLLADPSIEQLQENINEKQVQLNGVLDELENIRPIAESILQKQLSSVIAEMNLDILGQAVPPVLFHSTPLPWALIVSPRAQIGQEANISLQVEMSLPDQIALEDEVAGNLDVATLVVPVGGIGSYPTMIAQSSNLNWLAEVIAHEWIHNYLTLRPLGFLYNRSQELRTMNETVASIAGKELGRALIARFYPERAPSEIVPAPPNPELNSEQASIEAIEPVFDFRTEMHSTRIQVDALLNEGLIVEAEQYMEQRRLLFWAQGYAIRKINQAYFAFYGSYADVEAGPAGEDPVGDAVRRIWVSANSLSDFVNQLALITNSDELFLLSETLEKD